jgi:anti-sigma-K factor RskA
MSTMTQPACIGQPLSWLTLERHALDELGGVAATSAADHLAACKACAAALGTIEADRRVLPALPLAAAADDLARGRARTSRRRLVVGAGVFVAAAAALLLVVLRPKATDGELSARVRVKGAGVVVMTLVRERDGSVAFDPVDVRETDRFKVQLTCAPGGGATVEVVVLQAGEPEAVAVPAQPFACGNDVVLPGAFRITGGAATVCARMGEALACRRVR